MKDDIFKLIEEGLNSSDRSTQEIAKRFAQTIQRTSKIVREEQRHHIKDDGKAYLAQLAFMTDYLLHHPEMSLSQRLATIAPKLHEMELHQFHQLWVFHHHAAPRHVLQKRTTKPKTQKVSKTKKISSKKKKRSKK